MLSVPAHIVSGGLEGCLRALRGRDGSAGRQGDRTWKNLTGRRICSESASGGQEAGETPDFGPAKGAPQDSFRRGVAASPSLIKTLSWVFPTRLFASLRARDLGCSGKIMLLAERPTPTANIRLWPASQTRPFHGAVACQSPHKSAPTQEYPHFSGNFVAT